MLTGQNKWTFTTWATKGMIIHNVLNITASHSQRTNTNAIWYIAQLPAADHLEKSRSPEAWAERNVGRDLAILVPREGAHAAARPHIPQLGRVVLGGRRKQLVSLLGVTHEQGRRGALHAEASLKC
jgi:hypothetical protein